MIGTSRSGTVVHVTRQYQPENTPIGPINFVTKLQFGYILSKCGSSDRRHEPDKLNGFMCIVAVRKSWDVFHWLIVTWLVTWSEDLPFAIDIYFFPSVNALWLWAVSCVLSSSEVGLCQWESICSLLQVQNEVLSNSNTFCIFYDNNVDCFGAAKMICNSR